MSDDSLLSWNIGLFVKRGKGGDPVVPCIAILR